MNLVEAHAWFNISSALGFKEADKALALIEEDMTREQINEAIKLAKERFPKIKKAEGSERY